MNFQTNDRVTFPSDEFCKCTTGTVLAKAGNDNLIVLLDSKDKEGQVARVMPSAALSKISSKKYGLDSIISGMQDLTSFHKDGWYRIVLDVEMKNSNVHRIDELKAVYLSELTALKLNGFPSTKEIIDGQVQ